MDLKLSGLTIILLLENHLKAFLDSTFSISNRNLTDMANNHRVYHQQIYEQIECKRKNHLKTH